MGKVKQSLIDEEDFLKFDGAKEADNAFRCFVQDLNYYTKSGVYGPLIWQEVEEETIQIISNLVKISDLGCTNINEWKPE